VLPESAIPGLNGFVLFFALPCMLFRFGASMPFTQLIDPALIGVYLASAVLMVFFTIAATLRGQGDARGVPLRDAAFGALVAAFPNTGFMGVPLLVAMLGERAAGPVIGIVLVDLIFTSTLCLAVAQHRPQAQPAGGGAAAGATAANADAIDADPGWAVAALRSLRGALTNPLPWAIALGALLAAAGLQLPAPVGQVVKMLGDAATPVALFTIGTVLWRAGRHAHSRTPLRDYLPVALFKLFIHPALVLSMGLLARALGVQVQSFGLLVMVLGAALPSASSVSLLAERFGADNGRVARIVMASTVLAFGSFTLLAWGFGVQVGR
jgi:predicted permease